MLPWQAVVEAVKPHIVRISTPRGSGTGFLLYNSESKGFSAIATAAHVVSDAHFWEEPIRLQNAASGKSTIVRAASRAVLIHAARDIAAVTFQTQDLELPEEPLVLGPKDRYVKVGVEAGWLGFPAVSRELCFFSGRVSAYIEAEGRYLVDGVAINGVSGGPAFKPEGENSVSIIGVMSAYIPNRATGEVLPGLAVVADIQEFHSMVASFRSFEDALSKQTPPAEAEHSATADADQRPDGGQTRA